MKKDFYSKNNSEIQRLFFFETELNSYCEKCKTNNNYYFINCILEFDLDQILEKNNNIGKIKITDLLNKLTKKKGLCECNSDLISTTKFNSFPNYLIIVIQHKLKKEVNFEFEMEINLKKYKTDNNKDSYIYKLISFIESYSFKNKDGITICNSPENNQWYKYRGIEVKEVKEQQFNNNNYKNVPYLMIYKNNCVDSK